MSRKSFKRRYELRTTTFSGRSRSRTTDVAVVVLRTVGTEEELRCQSHPVIAGIRPDPCPKRRTARA
ncbi:hypothetical protein ACWCSH_21125, partial [Streptosporangium sp. NPDC001682]